MRVGLVCSNDTHVRMFAPVVSALSQRGIEAVALALDPFYGQNASGELRSLGLVATEPAFRRTDPDSRFYARPAPLVLNDVLHARRPIARAIRHMRVDRLVFGNDSGLIEKLVLASSRREGVQRRILVQDGRIISRRPAPAGVAASVSSAPRRLLSPVLRAGGLPYLARSEYGEGGAEVICAAGERSAQLFRERSRGRSVIVITGQPRYDRLALLQRDRAWGPIRSVAVFTTPFEQAGFGRQVQRRQEEMVAELHRSLRIKGIRVVVKPHPREMTNPYAQLVGAESVTSADSSMVLSSADAAVIGISTVVEEAVLMGCPVLVPGRFVHGDRFESSLPDPSAFPRCDTLPELVSAIRRMADPKNRAATAGAQVTVIAEEVRFSTEVSAASLVADAIAC